MVLRWHHVVLSMEQSRNNYVSKVCFTYNTYLLMTFWLLLHRKNSIAALWRTWRIIVGKLSLRYWAFARWRRGWRYVRANAKNAKSIMFRNSVPLCCFCLGLFHHASFDFCLRWLYFLQHVAIQKSTNSAIVTRLMPARSPIEPPMSPVNGQTILLGIRYLMKENVSLYSRWWYDGCSC